VQDDGRGTREQQRGNGLAGMEERLVALGGRLLLESLPGQGTRLRLRVPRLSSAAGRTFGTSFDPTPGTSLRTAAP